MRVFGRLWGNGDDDSVEAQYERTTLGGLAILLHTKTKHPIHYTCELCHEGYRHWLADDKVWTALPPHLQDETICLRCFFVLRTVDKLRKQFERRGGRRRRRRRRWTPDSTPCSFPNKYPL